MGYGVMGRFLTEKREWGKKRGSVYCGGLSEQTKSFTYFKIFFYEKMLMFVIVDVFYWQCHWYNWYNCSFVCFLFHFSEFTRWSPQLKSLRTYLKRENQFTCNKETSVSYTWIGQCDNYTFAAYFQHSKENMQHLSTFVLYIAIKEKEYTSRKTKTIFNVLDNFPLFKCYV